MRDSGKTKEELIKENRYLRSRLQQPNGNSIEDSFQQSKQTIKAVLNILNDSALIINKSGQIISFNEIARQILCNNTKDLKGKSIFNFFPGKSHNFIQSKRNEVLQNGIPVNFEEQRKEKIFDISIYPIFNKEEVIQMAVLARDVTEKKSLEESEYRKSLQLEQLLETARHLTSSLDLIEVLTRISSEAKDILKSYGCSIYLLDKEGTMLIPKVVVDPIYKDEIMESPIFVHNSFTGKAVLNKKAMMFNVAGPNTGGYQIPNTSVLENERIIAAPFIIDDTVIGALCLNRIGVMFTEEDLAIAETFAAYAAIALKNAQTHENLIKEVESRKDAEKKVAFHQEHLELINRILRHDLMNNLAVLKSTLRVYQAKKDDMLFSDFEKTINLSVDLINRMRESEAFLNTNKHIKIIPIRETIEMVLKRYPNCMYKINGNCSALADEAINSVIDNIIRNAQLHSKSKQLNIDIVSKPNICEIHFKDDGIGIPDEIKEKVFDESYRYGKTGNTGLGLYIVKKAIERIGGYVLVEDNIPKGADFIIGLKKIR